MLEVVVFLSRLGPGSFQGPGWQSAVNWQQQQQQQPEPRQFTDPADVSRRLTTSSVLDFQTNLLPIAMAAWTTIMENTGPVCACVCYKQMPNLC